MQRKKNTVKNSYQIAVIIGVIAFIVYGFVIYNRIRIFRYDQMFLYIAIEIAWLLVIVYWWLQWRKLQRQEKENNSIDDKNK